MFILRQRHLRVASAFFTNISATWFIALFVSQDFLSLIFDIVWLILNLAIANKIETILEDYYGSN